MKGESRSACFVVPICVYLRNLRRLFVLSKRMDRSTLNRVTQLVVILGGAFGLKFYYSTASVNQLRWILTPTTLLVEFVTGRTFEFESHAGYMSSDHTFLIAASCAGVNFLITAFLMLSLRKLWRERMSTVQQDPDKVAPTGLLTNQLSAQPQRLSDDFFQAAKLQRRRERGGRAEKKNVSWRAWMLLPVSAALAYVATIVANTVRISIALQLQKTPLKLDWLDANQLHRLEGIFVYFGFLLLLFVMSERTKFSEVWEASHSIRLFRFLRECFFPLLIYYATTLGLPLVNGAYRQTAFREHSLFLLLTPLAMILLIVTPIYFKSRYPRRRIDHPAAQAH